MFLPHCASFIVNGMEYVCRTGMKFILLSCEHHLVRIGSFLKNLFQVRLEISLDISHYWFCSFHYDILKTKTLSSCIPSWEKRV